jgi:hypothetical protein
MEQDGVTLDPDRGTEDGNALLVTANLEVARKYGFDDAEPDGCTKVQNCYACDARPGTLHKLGCDIEQCPYCGHQLLSCEHFFFGADEPPPVEDRLPWTGEWHGEAEAREFGWYSKRVPGVAGWVPCDQDDPGAGLDITRVEAEAEWDRQARRFVRRTTGQRR